MTINCKDIGAIPYNLASGDGFQVTFDISTWLGATDTIASVVYSATDGRGTDVTATALKLGSHTNTDTVIKPWILGPVAGSNKHYTVKMVVTTAAAMIKAFYIKFSVR